MFIAISGLKINRAQCSIAGIHIEEGEVEELALALGCEAGRLPVKHLGLPLGGNSREVNFWSPVVQKVERRLEIGGFQWGRLTLIQSVLISFAIYYLSVVKIPCSLAKRLEGLMSNF